MKYALIENGRVSNIIALNQRNAAEFLNAVQSDVAAIGDEYREGRFYREGELVKTQDELYFEALQENADMKEALEILGIEPEETNEDI